MSRVSRVAGCAVVVLTLISSAPAHAFGPNACAAVARALQGALPEAARWQPLSDAAARRAVADAFAAADAAGAEQSAAHERFVAGTPAASLLDSAVTAVSGDAPAALGDAVAGLTRAFAAHDAIAAQDAATAVAVRCADLADPFQTTAPDADELSGARATFCDLVTDPDLSGIVASEAVVGRDVMGAGVALATESAARRAAVDSAFAAGDGAALAALRRERLAAAITLGRALVRATWLEAGSPALVGGEAGRLAVWPCPARDQARVAFELPRAGEMTCELFDAAGRRVHATHAFVSAGAHSLDLGAALANLPAGIYLVRVSQTDFRLSGRLAHLGR